MLTIFVVALVISTFWAMLVWRILRNPMLVMRYNKYKPCGICNQLFPPTGLVKFGDVLACYGCYGGMMASQLLIEQVGEEKAQELRNAYMFANLLEALTPLSAKGMEKDAKQS